MNAKPLSRKESNELLGRLFPTGLIGSDIKNELVPNGWKNSALSVVFHPSIEQSYKEYIQMSRNLNRLRDEKEEPEATFKEFKEDFEDKPVKPEQELRELMGLCLWDVISNNHDIVKPTGEITYFGSFRATGGVIADWLNGKSDDSYKYGYLDFYMGTVMISQRADLAPVYRLIFNRLNEHHYDWIYHFPQLNLINFNRDIDEDKPEDYDPAKSVAEELEKKKKEREGKDFEDEIHQMNREAAERAAQNDPPSIVLAYKKVYGKLPKGWPPG